MLPVESPLPAPANPQSNPSAEFDAQTRDPAWAGPTEKEIAKRVGKGVERAECRHDRCLITVRGDEGEMSDVIAKLESPAGLSGYAQTIYLTKPVEQDGKLVMRAYATFDR